MHISDEGIVSSIRNWANKNVEHYRSRVRSDTVRVVRKSMASLVVRVTGNAVGLLVSIVLGRTLGPRGLGIINLSNQVVSLLLVIVMMGMGNVVINQSAIAHQAKDDQSINDTIYTSLWINGAMALAISVTGAFLAPTLANGLFSTPNLIIPLTIAFITILPQSLSRVFASGLNGLGKVWQSNLVGDTMSIWVVGLGLLIFASAQVKIDVVTAAMLYGVGRFVVAISMALYWRRTFRFKGKSRLIGKPMVATGLPLLLVSGTMLIAANADVVMLGWLSNTTQVGLYTVAARLALIVSLFLFVSNSALSPIIASFFSQGKVEELSKLVKQVTALLMIIAFVSLAVFVFGGHFILGLWGRQFESAYSILTILALGQFVNISTGCAGMLLIMCGFQKTHAYLSVIFVLANILLNYILIQKFGGLGAAVATAVTVGTENITKVVVAKRKVGILTIPLSG